MRPAAESAFAMKFAAGRFVAPWCWRGELNPHAVYTARDFESRASANSATPAGHPQMAARSPGRWSEDNMGSKTQSSRPAGRYCCRWPRPRRQPLTALLFPQRRASTTSLLSRNPIECMWGECHSEERKAVLAQRREESRCSLDFKRPRRFALLRVTDLSGRTACFRCAARPGAGFSRAAGLGRNCAAGAFASPAFIR